MRPLSLSAGTIVTFFRARAGTDVPAGRHMADQDSELATRDPYPALRTGLGEAVAVGEDHELESVRNAELGIN